MCWSIVYHENKIPMDNPIMDYSLYKKVNVLGNFDNDFQIDKIFIGNKLFYNITHNLCACDFFVAKNLNLREGFKKFILKRMEIICVEPCIFIKWIDDSNSIKELPKNKVPIYESNVLDIFTEEYMESYYCVKNNFKIE